MSLAQTLIPLNNQAEWELALQNVPHLHSHCHWYNRAMHLATQQPIFLYYAHSKTFHAACPFLLRRRADSDAYDITTPYGFSGFASVGRYEGFHTQWREFMRSHDFVCGHVALHPLLNTHLQFAKAYATKPSYVLATDQPLEKIAGNLSVDHKQRLKQWQKQAHIVLTEKTPPLQAAFISLYSQALQQRQAAKIYDFGEAAWRALFAAPQTQLFSIYQDDTVTAAAVFIHHQEVVDYFMLASTPAGRQHARGLIWHAIQYCQANAAKYLFLGCGVQADDSLAQFKARFGSQVYPTYSLREIFQPATYHALCRKYHAPSQPENSYFPHYWA